MSLKKKFLILIFLIFCGTIAISFFAYKNLKNEIMSITGSLFLKKQIQFNRERVLHPIMRELVLAQKLATSPSLIKWAKNEKNPECMKNGIAELESFRSFFTDRSYFYGAYNSGNYYFNDSENNFANKQLRYMLDPNKPENRWFFATIESGDDYRLNVDYDEKLGVTKVWINVVLKNDGKPLGIVGTGIDLSKFIKKVIGSDQTGISNILIAKDGAIQAHKKLDEIDYRTISKTSEDKKTIFSLFKKEKCQAKLIDAMILAKKNTKQTPVFFTEIDERPHLLGISYIKEIGWFNVSILDIGKVIGQDQFIPFAGLLIMALILFSSAIYILLNKFIFSRIKLLDQSVSRFAKGILPDYPEDSITDEVGHLETGFQKMADKLKAKTDELEYRVTERTKELQQEKERAENALKAEHEAIQHNLNFIDMISHEYRTPLSVMSSSLDLLERKFPIKEFPDLTNQLKRMRKSTKELLTIFETSLNEKRIDNSGIVFFEEEVKLIALLEVITEFTHYAHPKHNIVIKYNIPDNFTIKADKELLKVAIINLLDNACKYSNSGQVMLNIEINENFMIITIEDNGVGIKKEELKHIFEKYYRSDSVRKKSGVGVGLFLVKKIIKLHGGEIKAESEWGKGTKFVISIPKK